MTPLIELCHIYRTYRPGPNAVEALKNVSLQIESGEFTAIIGSSGSGKSTLMNILGCLDVPDRGTYRLDNVDVSSLSDDQLSIIRNQKIGFIFQSFNLIPSLNALENVALPLCYRKMPREERYRLSTDALTEVGLRNRMSHLPSQMSGGQQQRVAIARAIAAQPSILLADEPTGNLDKRSGKAVINILLRLNKEGKTIILITHDPNVAAYAKRVLTISDGKLVSEEHPSD